MRPTEPSHPLPPDPEPFPWARDLEPADGGRRPDWFQRSWLEMVVFGAAILGRLPALGSWWTLDDWGLLARAAGQAAPAVPGNLPARVLSQHLWWDLTWPLFGLNTDPHGWLRLIIHGCSCVLVTRIGTRAGLDKLARLVAGLLFAATPLAFTPLYWAAGIQELLAGCFALLAVERWLAGGRGNLALAAGAAVLSMAAKESGLALPLLLTAFLWLGLGVHRNDRAFAWALAVLLVLVSASEAALVLNHFATAAGDPYAMGGPIVWLGNLGVFGWWMLTVGPFFASRITWPMAAAGCTLFLLWGMWATFRWRRGSVLAALTLLAALLSLTPALGLNSQVHPYLAYLAAAAGALALADLVSGHWPLRRTTAAILACAAIGWGFLGMELRLSKRDDGGLPADPVVRATALSWQACSALRQLPLTSLAADRPAVVLLQMPANDTLARMADQLGDSWVTGSSLYEAVGGSVGPQLVLGPDVRVIWANNLASVPRDALVLCESAAVFRHWGPTSNALLYAALTDIGQGRFERARRHLIRAGKLNEDTIGFVWDPGQMIIPLSRVLEQRQAFVDWTVSLLDQGSSVLEVGGLQEMYFNLLSSCTGRSIEELSAGSSLLMDTDSQLNKVPTEERGRIDE